MPATTTRWALRSPLGSEPADAPLHIGQLATDSDSFAKDLQGLLSARPAAAATNYGLYYWATDTKVLYRSDGAAWQPFGPQTQTVTTLPAGPIDGQEVYYIVDSANSVVWHMRWRTAVSRWEFLGGPPYQIEINSAQPLNAPGDVWVDLTGPQLTIPKAGEYDITFGANTSNVPSGPSGWMAQIGLNIGGVQPGTAEASVCGGPSSTAAASHQLGRTIRKTCATNAIVRMWYEIGGQPNSFMNRYLRIIPFRIT